MKVVMNLSNRTSHIDVQIQRSVTLEKLYYLWHLGKLFATVVPMVKVQTQESYPRYRGSGDLQKPP